MMEPTDQISYPGLNNHGMTKLVEKPALSDRDFRSFLDNVGELVRYEFYRSIFSTVLYAFDKKWLLFTISGILENFTR